MAEKKQKKPKKETKPDKPEKTKTPKAASKAENVIYIGRKPPMSYVLALMTSFGDNSVKEVTLKARGQAITTAVDVAEIAKRRFIKDAKVGGITIGTEEVSREQGGTRNVSTIEITIAKA
ncbi:MAG: DNA-binding protein Alba [Candidatus Bathyarchaeota archaeon]|nr:MAG: DNA-binding protein Alba [Candidatus Bathyarchaeota archaeon]